MSAEMDGWERAQIDRLAKYVEGAFSIDTPDSVVKREARIIAEHARELIKREVGWIEKGLIKRLR